MVHATDIILARRRISGYLRPTPLEAVPGLGDKVWLKLENANRTHSFKVRGAMNADNPDTAKIISSLLAGLMREAMNAVPDKQAQSVLQSIKMTPRDNEIVWEADIPEQAIADIFKPAEKAPTVVGTKPTPTRRAPVRKKRTK